VFVVDANQKAVMRPVKVRYQDQDIAALDNALKAGETVVTDGQLRLTPNAPVSIVPAAGDQPAAAPVDPPATGKQAAKGQKGARGARRNGAAQ
jgi:multidrug efflux system membrane fusion protein